MGFFSAVKGMWTIAISVGRTENPDGKNSAKKVSFENGIVTKIENYTPSIPAEV
jgi:hypothetical protein